MIKLYSYLKIRQSSRIHRIQTSNRQDYEKPNTQFLPSSLLIIQDTRIQLKTSYAGWPGGTVVAKCKSCRFMLGTNKRLQFGEK